MLKIFWNLKTYECKIIQNNWNKNMNDTKCKYNLPDPQTTKMKRPNNQGPTAYFSSAGFCNLIIAKIIHVLLGNFTQKKLRCSLILYNLLIVY